MDEVYTFRILIERKVFDTCDGTSTSTPNRSTKAKNVKKGRKRKASFKTTDHLMRYISATPASDTKAKHPTFSGLLIVYFFSLTISSAMNFPIAIYNNATINEFAGMKKSENFA